MQLLHTVLLQSPLMDSPRDESASMIAASRKGNAGLDRHATYDAKPLSSNNIIRFLIIFFCSTTITSYPCNNRKKSMSIGSYQIEQIKAIMAFAAETRSSDIFFRIHPSILVWKNLFTNEQRFGHISINCCGYTYFIFHFNGPSEKYTRIKWTIFLKN